MRTLVPGVYTANASVNVFALKREGIRQLCTVWAESSSNSSYQPKQREPFKHTWIVYCWVRIDTRHIQLPTTTTFQYYYCTKQKKEEEEENHSLFRCVQHGWFIISLLWQVRERKTIFDCSFQSEFESEKNGADRLVVYIYIYMCVICVKCSECHTKTRKPSKIYEKKKIIIIKFKRIRNPSHCWTILQSRSFSELIRN